MKSITKLIILFIMIALAMVGGAYYYLFSMKTVNGNLNVNKVDMINKLYTYDVYGDFYFTVQKYDNKGKIIAEYRELQPLKTELGYDLSNKRAKLIVKSNLNGKKMILSDEKDKEIDSEIEWINNFEKAYGEILATQDKSIINRSFKQTQKIVKQLYNQDNYALDTNHTLYTKIDNLAVKNIDINYLNLDHKAKIEIQPKDLCFKSLWKFVSWSFNKNTNIYLEYDVLNKKKSLEGYLKPLLYNMTLMKLVKIVNNKPQVVYLLKNDKNMKAYYTDTQRHIFNVTFKSVNTDEAYKEYISDYLKIVMGISVLNKDVDTQCLDDKDKAINVIKNNLVTLQIINKDLNKAIKDIDKNALSYFDIPLLEKIYDLDRYTAGNLFPSTKAYDNFNDYLDYLESLKNKLQDGYDKKSLLKEALNEYYHFYSIGNALDKLKEKCPNGDIECLQELKDKGWE